uniref:Butyrophilin subfamily 1 member A1 n=1 Tax=Anas platyrhynchos TaxID=8839 RepID=A0A8B9ZED4_ANAPL
MGLPWGCGCPSLTGHARGLLTSLVTLLLLQLGSAQLRVEGPDYPLTATVGQDVVLRCYLSPQRDARSLEVRWIRDHISETVHHYRNGQDLYREQMEAYAGRTELSRDGLSAGSLDLRITGLRPSDDGRYVCTVEDADAYNEAVVELEVSATGADPHLSLGGYEAGGVRVLCRSAGWYPLPQLLWRDARGQHLPSDPQTHSQDQEGLFEIEGAVTVTGSVEGPLSCVVRSSRLQQERESSLHITAPFFHNAQPWKVALALVLVLLAVSIGLGVYLFRKQAAQRRELEKQAAELEWRKFLLPHNTDPAPAAAQMGLPWGCSHPSLTGHARGLLTSLVTLHLLQLGSAQLRVEGPGHPVTATVGQDVVLPCHLSPKRDARELEVRWIRRMISETVHHYHNGEDLYGEQMGAYAGRTELSRDGLSAGSLDLRITGLRPSDDGLYVCIVEDADAYNEAVVELEVSAPFFHNAQPWMVALALVLVLLAVSVGLSVYLFRKQAAQRRELEKQAAELAWRKFLLPHNTVKVTLDPSTAHPQLVMSQDKRTVRREMKQQQVPDTEERFDNWGCVLGREEFREGRHCWQVEGVVGNNSWWAVGVARASVKKKGNITVSPKEGIWALDSNDGQPPTQISSRTPLSLSPVLKRIWVCLDYTKGQVSFINADNGVKIFTFKEASFNGESIRPWFWLGINAQLCLRDSTPQTLSLALRGSSTSTDTPVSPLLDPGRAAQN